MSKVSIGEFDHMCVVTQILTIFEPDCTIDLIRELEPLRKLGRGKFSVRKTGVESTVQDLDNAYKDAIAHFK